MNDTQILDHILASKAVINDHWIEFVRRERNRQANQCTTTVAAQGKQHTYPAGAACALGGRLDPVNRDGIALTSTRNPAWEQFYRPNPDDPSDWCKECKCWLSWCDHGKKYRPGVGFASAPLLAEGEALCAQCDSSHCQCRVSQGTVAQATITPNYRPKSDIDLRKYDIASAVADVAVAEAVDGLIGALNELRRVIPCG